VFGAVWIGPFDQLVSAGRALLKANKLAYDGRLLTTYYFEVHAKVVPLLIDEAEDREISSPKDLENFLSSFYFNAGIQRLTFAAERLLATFVAIPCGQRAAEVGRSRNGKWPKLQDCCEKAQQRLNHLANQDGVGKSLDGFRSFLAALSEWDYRTFCPEKGLSMLRDHVNMRKHSVYLRSEAVKYGPIGPTGELKWAPTDQTEIAVSSFVLTASSYNELVKWHPNASG